MLPLLKQESPGIVQKIMEMCQQVKKVDEKITKIVEYYQKLEELLIKKQLKNIIFDKKIKELGVEIEAKIKELKKRSYKIEELTEIKIEKQDKEESIKTAHSKEENQIIIEINTEKAKINQQLETLEIEKVNEITVKMTTLNQLITKTEKEKINQIIIEINTEKADEMKNKLEELKQKLEKKADESAYKKATLNQLITEIEPKIAALNQQVKELKTIKTEEIATLMQDTKEIVSQIPDKINQLNHQITEKVNEKLAKKATKMAKFKEEIKGKINSIDHCLKLIKDAINNISNLNSGEANSTSTKSGIGFNFLDNKATKYFAPIGKFAKGVKKKVTEFVQETRDRVIGFGNNWTLDQCHSKKNDIENEIEKLKVKKLGEGWNNFWKNCTCGIFDWNARLDRKIEKRQKDLNEVEIKINEIIQNSQVIEEQSSTSANLRSKLNSKLVEECNNAEAQVHSVPLETCTKSNEMLAC